MKASINKIDIEQARATFSAFCMAVFFVAFLAVPGAAFAQADTKVEEFFENIRGLLTIASISVVTIAVIFAGYQIAFAHKRIADVAPILIGGFLIGAAAQIAGMLLGPDEAQPPPGMAMLMNAVSSWNA
jgi:type IV secretion system protein VirB2